MGKEIERKFLVENKEYRKLAKPILYKQGYLSTDKDRTVRIRTLEDKAYITIKGPSAGITRAEFEYEIPLKDAENMLNELCKKPIIEKYRYRIVANTDVWEVDEFFGDNEGLIIAEIELKQENQKIQLPDWIGEDVTGDTKYYNSNLISNPYRHWKNINIK